MSIFYSYSSGGFYPAEMRDSYEAAGTWPVDGFEISAGEHALLVAGASAGQRIASGADGRPTLVEALALSPEQVEVAARDARDTAIRATDWLVLRHQDEQLLGGPTTLVADDFAQLIRYRQALRDISEMPDWPSAVLPVPPKFIEVMQP